MRAVPDYSLYLVISEEYTKGRSAFDVAKSAVSSGVNIVQMREKNKSHEELLLLGSKLSKLCRKNGVLFIVNDNPELALALDADGVHLGQEDILKYPIPFVRRIVGKKIIGLSTHSITQVREANNLDVDYIAFGPLFATKTKDYFIGVKNVRKVIEIAEKPVIAIGGINLDNMDKLLGLGVRNIAMIRAITEADNIALKVKEFRYRIDQSVDKVSNRINPSFKLYKNKGVKPRRLTA